MGCKKPHPILLYIDEGFMIIPNIAGYGATNGVYGGPKITSLTASGEVDTSQLNNNFEVDGYTFNNFERTVYDYILAKLGHPVVRVELTPFQLKTCIDEAITQLDYHAPQWMQQYAVFDASAGVNLYELPPMIINNINYVVYKKDLLAFNYIPGTLEFDFFLGFWSTNRFFSNLSIGDFYLTQQYLEMARRVLSADGTWEVVGNKYLQLHPVPQATPTPVIVEYRAMNSDTIHPAYRNWIQKYATACAKETLGRIRSKYQILPGPGGGSQLDGQVLLQESVADKEKLMEELTLAIEEPPMFSTG